MLGSSWQRNCVTLTTTQSNLHTLNETVSPSSLASLLMPKLQHTRALERQALLKLWKLYGLNQILPVCFLSFTFAGNVKKLFLMLNVVRLLNQNRSKVTCCGFDVNWQNSLYVNLYVVSCTITHYDHLPSDCCLFEQPLMLMCILS